MLMYDYHCPACGIDFERIVKMDNRDKQTCACGNFLSRQISSCAPPVFKGVSGSCSMDKSMKLPDTTLTTSPR